MISSLLQLPLSIALTFTAALLYLISAVIFFVAAGRERNELTVAFLAFLSSMAIYLALLGMGQYTRAAILTYLGVFAVFTGSCVMLRLPLAALPQPLRNLLFSGSLLVSWSLLAWLMLTPIGRQLLLPVTGLYMVAINGGITGLYLLGVGLKSKTPWVKVKATGGGLGIASCCVAAHLAGVAGAPLLVSAFFQIFSPIIILLAIFSGRRIQRQSERGSVPTPS